jgi:hypothetical protein
MSKLQAPVVTYNRGGVESYDRLSCLTARLCEYANGTLVAGSGAEVYVVLDNFRHWIPDETTFDTMGYNWNEIRSLSENGLNAIPEGSPFPRVAPQSGSLIYANGTLVKGSSANVYVILNDHRYLIPDAATFNAMGYDWSKILSLPDNRVNAIPQGSPFLVYAVN